MKKVARFSIIPFCLVILTGCWDRTEVNDLAFITATGFDMVDENLFSVSVQAPLPGSMGGPGGGGGGTSGDKPYYVDAGKGRNVREANDDLQRRMSREMFFAHRRVVVMGEKLASNGMERSLELILEHPESRLSTYLLVAKGEAIDVLTASPHFELLPAETVRELTKRTLDIDTRKVLNALHLPGKDPVIPVVRTVKTQNKGDEEEEEIQIDGVAIFKDDVLQFLTNKEETLGVYWILKRMKDKSLTVPIRSLSEININIPDYKVRPSFSVKNNRPEFTIKLNVKCNLAQNEPNLDFEDEDTYKMVTRKIENAIKSQVEAIINHGKEEGVDPFGLGWLVYRTNNMLWEQHLKENWRELLPDIPVTVKVNAEIVRINNKGIKIREA